MQCAVATCQRGAEVVVHIDELAVPACLTDGIQIALELTGRVVLLGQAGEELTIRPRGA